MYGTVVYCVSKVRKGLSVGGTGWLAASELLWHNGGLRIRRYGCRKIKLFPAVVTTMNERNCADAGNSCECWERV